MIGTGRVERPGDGSGLLVSRKKGVVGKGPVEENAHSDGEDDDERGPEAVAGWVFGHFAFQVGGPASPFFRVEVSCVDLAIFADDAIVCLIQVVHVGFVRPLFLFF